MEKRKNLLLNAAIGDAAGSIYEYYKNRIKYKPNSLINPRCRVTDDTVMTIAIAEAIMNEYSVAESKHIDYSKYMRKWGNIYPNAGYGGMFRRWLSNPNMGAYGSFGNGSAMRVSPCAYIDLNLTEAEESAKVTHNHPEGIKGAVCISDIIASLLSKKDDEDPKKIVAHSLCEYYPNYNVEPLDEIRKYYRFDSTCQGSVPQSIQCVLEANDYEDALKLAISMGGDSDTMACIAGSIAGVIWEVPEYLIKWIREITPKDLLEISDRFDEYINS